MSRAQQSLAVAIAMLVVAAGIGVAVLSRGHKRDAAAHSGAHGGSGTTAPTGPQALGSHEQTTTTVKADSSATTWHTPAAGTYRYHYSRAGAGPLEYDSTVVVATTGSHSYTETRDQQSVSAIRLYSVDGGALREAGFTVDTGSDRQTCHWDHPLTEIPAGPSPGKQTASNATCTLRLAGTSTTIKFESTLKVVGFRDAKLAGATVPLLRIDGRSKVTTTTDKSTIVRTSSSIEYFDMNRGLLAQSTEDAVEEGPSGRSAFRIVETMLTVQPEVSR
jgi:hypothetical protein